MSSKVVQIIRIWALSVLIKRSAFNHEVDRGQTRIWLVRQYCRAEYGTHSMRRTKAPMIYKATDNLQAIQILLGHSKIENTVRYLGVDIEDALQAKRKLISL